MSQSVRQSLDLLEVYLERIRSDLEDGDRSQALSDAAELFETARRLWAYLANAQNLSCIEAQLKLAAGGEN
jgi:hypothetical protein